MFIITSESDSEAGYWGNSDCSLQEKSGGSGLLASFHGGGLGHHESTVQFLIM